ncbi:hypothetical protein FPSE_01900 [Fusarium pseudograminearum CS3096]|uniref:Uncharacterized protein n=2 Tax=Fusarium pseudograminearum TaxID=101028 RepID=K3VRV0_FUSPC|nr:hypothetical protein FPSE_01900 [Fusarium pseudograminearum CS3096]EKJ77974.1 hypothetical protein FPSE_01900 [Fusarium pseudograminearum CS3096]CEG02441.1 unnamed protein product [Fusarium pseudograminearum CS3427]
MPTRLTTDCRLALDWISKTQNERKHAKHAEVVQTSLNTKLVADLVHNGEDDDDSYDDSDTNNMNIPEDSLMPEYGDGINALRSFTPTKPETDSCRSLVNHIQVPEHQQPIPRKRDANADEEMSRVENSYQISTKRNIYSLNERIENTENLMELCSNELIEKQHDAYKCPGAGRR